MTLRTVAASIALLLSASAAHAGFICQDGYVVGQCWDGHTIKCGNPQVDCTEHSLDWDALCANYGGWQGLVQPEGILEYFGAFDLGVEEPGGDVTGVVDTVEFAAVCEDGTVDRCEDSAECAADAEDPAANFCLDNGVVETAYLVLEEG